MTVCVIICIKQIQCGCNERTLIAPCLCYGLVIDYNNRYDNRNAHHLDIVFSKLSKLLNDTEKKFESLIIDNLNITSLNANTVKDLVLKEKIIIQFNSKRFQWNRFSDHFYDSSIQSKNRFSLQTIEEVFKCHGYINQL